MTSYICLICGYVHVGEVPPEHCPICDAPASQFELMTQTKGTEGTNGFKCLNCDYSHEGTTPPEICPVCGMGADRFEAIDLQQVAEVASDIEHVVILGSGIAAVSSAEKLRQMNASIEITIVTNEVKLPYYRLNLTRYLADEVSEGSLCIHPQYWYDEQRIQILKNRIITDIDLDNNRIISADGLEVPYDRLIIALGAHAFIPPFEGISKAGVGCLRSVDEAIDLKSQIKQGTSVLVIGGGVLGLETAGAIAAIGGKVTVAEGAPWLMPLQLNEKGSSYVAQRLNNIGIELIYNYRCAKVVKEGNLTKVYDAEAQVLEVEIVVLATGVRPNTYLARKAGIEVNRGIVVDDYMQTSVEGVYAVGDVTEHYGVAYGLWNIAQYQGSIAAMNLLGVKTSFGGVPRSNALKVLDVALFSIGEIEGSDASYSVIEKADESRYVRCLIRDQVLVGAIAIGYSDYHHKIKKMVESKRHLLPSEYGTMDDLLEVLKVSE